MVSASSLGAGGALAAGTRSRHAPHHPHTVRPVRSHGSRRANGDRSKPVIVIDPGHGGVDPGTVGRSGTLEKIVTLQTAMELARLLSASGRYEVLMTRQDDRFVSLSERAAYSRVHGAALIVSLHADASADHSARGTSVYIRSNATGGTGLKATPPGRLAGMAQALGKPPTPHAGSAWLQTTMIDKLDDAMEMTAAPAREAHLWVLANPGIPGVLVEMGFLSNRQDEKLMRNGRHRLLIARLIRDAVDGYFASIVHSGESRT
jgi:N-acetylmuramoyl-L-alanine amidase